MLAAILMMLAASIAAPAQGFKTLVDFTGTSGGYSYSSLAQGVDGSLYGTTDIGGLGGTVFKMTPAGNLATVYEFCAKPGCTDGLAPKAGVNQIVDGNFYGTTYYGGAYGYGTVFKLTPDGGLARCTASISPPTAPGRWRVSYRAGTAICTG